MVLGDKCPKCGGEMGHRSANNFHYVWFICVNCGHRDGDIPKDVLKFHASCFKKGK